MAIASKSISFWASEFIALENGLDFNFSKHKYLLQPYQDDSRVQVHKKCAQVGITTMAMLKAIHGCINKFPLGVIYFFPTDRDVSDFSKSRIKPLINNNQHLQNKIADTDEVGLKQVGKSFIYFRGLRSKSQIKSVPADMIVIDEKDEAPPESCEMARKRLGHSDYKHELYLSNPTIPNYAIDKDFQDSDQHHWLIICTSCNHYNNPIDNFPNNIILGVDGKRSLSCEKCGNGLDRFTGEWVAKYQNRDIRGYQYNLFMSPYVSVDEIWQDYVKALDTGRLNIFYNMVLGLAYVSSKEKLEPQQVGDLCSNSFPKDPFQGSEAIFMGVDQGKDIHCVFKKKVGDNVLTWFAVHKEFEELQQYMDKIRICIIDALPETRKAREIAIKNRGKIFLNFYNVNQKGQARFNEEDFTVQENRTESLDASHILFTNKVNVLPARDYQDMDSFIDHCSNIAKKLEEDEESGSKRYVWVKLGEDHYRHADNYATIAMNSELASEPSIRFI